MSSRHNSTPYLLKAKFAGKCSDSRCEAPIQVGDEILYYPASRKVVSHARSAGR